MAVRKCHKCGCTAAKDNVKLFRFPKPGLKNLTRCTVWAKFIFPDKDYSSIEFQLKLHKEWCMLCERHFTDADFHDHTKQKLVIYSVPYDEDKKEELLDKLRESSMMPVPPNVTLSTADDGNVKSEADVVDVKQEILDEQDVDTMNTVGLESPDITIGPTMIGSQVMSDEQEQSFGVSCKSEETHDTRDTAAAAGDQQYQHEEYSADLDDEAPVANQPELEAQNRASEVVNCVKYTKNIKIESGIAMVDASVSKLFNEINITPSVNNNSKTQDNNPLGNNTTISNLTLKRYLVDSGRQFKSNSENLNKYRRSDFNKRIKITDKVCNKHLTNGNKIFTCNECYKKFTRKNNLVYHMRIHTGYKLFTCNFCSKSFNIKANLVVHTRIHTGEKPFSCNVCNKSYISKWNLLSHTRIHTGDKLFTCNFCSKSFNIKANLVVHIRIHTGEKPFSCNVCNKSFITKWNLLSHTRNHTGDKLFTCNFCSKSFNTKANLVVHIRIHTGEKPFSCKVCNKSFISKCNLLSHTRIHTGDKPFSCDVCNKSFTIKSNLLSHTRVHTGDKPFTCIMCNKKFASKQTLGNHMRIHTDD